MTGGTRSPSAPEPRGSAADPSGSALPGNRGRTPSQSARSRPGSTTASVGGAGTGSPGVISTDPGQVIVPEINTAIVARGDNLWRISKRIYGRGLRYTVIFDANTPQIRDPDLIYPGQVFVLPPGAQSDRR